MESWKTSYFLSCKSHGIYYHISVASSNHFCARHRIEFRIDLDCAPLSFLC